MKACSYENIKRRKGERFKKKNSTLVSSLIEKAEVVREGTKRQIKSKFSFLSLNNGNGESCRWNEKEKVQL